jgi:hypothetical protein
MRWDKWAAGLLNSIASGLGTAVAGYLATLATGQAPEWRVMGTMVLISALWNFSSYLKEHKLPIGDDAIDPALVKDR